MPSGYKDAHSCPKCKVETMPNQAGLYHCNTDGCPISHFKVDFFGKAHSITYCADIGGEEYESILEMPIFTDSTPPLSLKTLDEVVGNYGGSLCEPESEPMGERKNK